MGQTIGLCRLPGKFPQYLPPAEPGVQNKRIKIGATRPKYAAELRMDANPPELVGVAQGRKHALKRHDFFKVDYALDRIVESQKHSKGDSSRRARFQSSIRSFLCILAHSTTNPQHSWGQISFKNSECLSGDERPLAAI